MLAKKSATKRSQSAAAKRSTTKAKRSGTSAAKSQKEKAKNAATVAGLKGCLAHRIHEINVNQLDFSSVLLHPRKFREF